MPTVCEIKLSVSLLSALLLLLQCILWQYTYWPSEHDRYCTISQPHRGLPFKFGLSKTNSSSKDIYIRPPPPPPEKGMMKRLKVEKIKRVTQACTKGKKGGGIKNRPIAGGDRNIFEWGFLGKIWGFDQIIDSWVIFKIFYRKATTDSQNFLKLSYLQCEEQCPYGSYGQGCRDQCRCKRGACHPVDGRCSCPPGWTGPLCDQRACQRPELYGPQCSLICRCHPDNTDM